MRQWMVDAFAKEPFKGNQACVVEPFPSWPEASWMQALAHENNQSETAFLLQTSDPLRFGLRWFTPAVEAPICGHATLAAGHVLMSELGVSGASLSFDTQAGLLTVRPAESGYVMDFPNHPPVQTDIPETLCEALGIRPQEVWAANYLVALFKTEAEIKALRPNMAALAGISGGCTGGPGNLAVAAVADAGSVYDVVDRFFAPGSGISEDPATGSAHCILAPLFAHKLGRTQLKFFQAYPGRGAEISTAIKGDRVELIGSALTILEAELRIRP